MPRLFFVVMFLALFSACTVKEDDGPSVPDYFFDQVYYDSSTDTVVTGRSALTTAYSSTLSARFSIPTSKVKSGWTWGVVVSEDPHPDPLDPRSVVFQSKLRQIAFSVVASGLKMNTRYYYCAYLREGAKKYRLGHVMYFTTRNAKVSSAEPVVHSPFAATLGGWTDVNLKDQNFKGEVGVLFSSRMTDRPHPDIDSFIPCEPCADDTANFVVRLSDLVEEHGYVYQAYVRTDSVIVYGKVKSFKTGKVSLSQDEAVDLGLSVKWASRNLGAEHCWDVGNYYGYGEPTGTVFTKRLADYSGKDDIRGTEDDMASVAYADSSWQMPSWNQFTELRTKCDWHWTEIEQTSGYLVTGTTGNSIFLPASGYTLDGANVLGNMTTDPSGYYWSGIRNDLRDSHAYYLFFNKSGSSVESRYRYFGMAARAVKVR